MPHYCEIVGAFLLKKLVLLKFNLNYKLILNFNYFDYWDSGVIYLARIPNHGI